MAKKKNKKNSAPKATKLQYESIGDTLSLDVALGQAAHMLDLASKKATAEGTAADISRVADGWASLAKSMVEVFNESQAPRPIGFSGGNNG